MQKNRQIRFVGNGNVTILIAIFSGIMILAINMGLRQAMLPLFIPDMVTDLGWRMGDITLAFAVQNLVWGGVSPIAGLAAERYGTVKTLMVGALIYGVGLLGVGLDRKFLTVSIRQWHLDWCRGWYHDLSRCFSRCRSDGPCL